MWFVKGKIILKTNVCIKLKLHFELVNNSCT